MENPRILKIITIILIFLFVGAIWFAATSDTDLLTSKESGTLGENQKPTALIDLPELPIKGVAPEITGIHDWINSEPLSFAKLKGKVVLVDFWTYSCINCIRTLPHTQGWYEKYKDSGFMVLGVHTPEFEFEHKKENVITNVAKYNLTYPVALDNDYKTWRAFENRFWPAHYLVDAEGNIRFTHFGEGRYAETEMAIQKLLLEAGLLPLSSVLEAKEPTSQVDFQQIGSPEIYLGADRARRSDGTPYIGNDVTGVLISQPHEFKKPDRILPNRFYLDGTWSVAREFTELESEEGSITFQYLASKVNMVLESKEEVILEVKLDGKPLTDTSKGTDIFLQSGESFMKVQEPRLYNLVDTKDMYETHTVEILAPTPGLQAFTFTFG
jgi:thiol-disulfide isomerase/thioredoxin